MSDTKISEAVIIETLLQLAFAAWCVAGDGEEMPDGSVCVAKANYESLASHLDTLDKLPDQPGYVCEATAKARWALRGLLNPQPAELAEQQGVNGWDIAEKVRADLDRQSCPDAYMRIAVESVVKHLAATGKQQAGENPAWRDELVREAHARGLMEGLNSPRPQQVGEVQGDADRLWPELDRLLVDAYNAGTEGDEFDILAARKTLIAALAARQPGVLIAQKVGDYRVTVAEGAITVSHGRDVVFAFSAGDAEPIIARQTGAQEPVLYQMWNPCGGWDECTKAEHEDWQRRGGGKTSRALYAAPPAQGIDLGRALDIMWNWQEQLGGHVFDARDVARTLTSSDMQAIGVDARACIDATDRNQAIVLAKREIVRALSGDQRDAAPGVDRG